MGDAAQRRRQPPNSKTRPLVVPVFLPHAGCRHRCAFCNQHTLTGTPSALPTAAALRHRIASFLEKAGPGRSPVEIAFYGGNALGLPEATVRRLFGLAAAFVDAGRVHGIRCSTRPDSVSADLLERLVSFPMTTVELGVQSMDDRVLAAADRGHDAAAVPAAVHCLKARGLAVGIQLMIGLPGDDRERALESARRVTALRPDFVRIYPTLVLSGSPLAERYRRGDYRPLSLEEAVLQAQRLYLHFRRHGIPVIRMGLQETEELAARDGVVSGPRHPAFGELVASRCFLDLASAALDGSEPPAEGLVLRVNPRSESKCRGWRNRNLDALKARFRVRTIRVETDAELGEDVLAVNGRPALGFEALEA